MSTVGPQPLGLRRGAGEPLLNLRAHVEGVLFLRSRGSKLVAPAHHPLVLVPGGEPLS